MGLAKAAGLPCKHTDEGSTPSCSTWAFWLSWAHASLGRGEAKRES